MHGRNGLDIQGGKNRNMLRVLRTEPGCGYKKKSWSGRCKISSRSCGTSQELPLVTSQEIISSFCLSRLCIATSTGPTEFWVAELKMLTAFVWLLRSPKASIRWLQQLMCKVRCCPLLVSFFRNNKVSGCFKIEMTFYEVLCCTWLSTSRTMFSLDTTYQLQLHRCICI